MDVNHYTNDNDEKYCYCSTAGDAGCLQHYSLPWGCRGKRTIFIFHFIKYIRKRNKTWYSKNL